MAVSGINTIDIKIRDVANNCDDIFLTSRLNDLTSRHKSLTSQHKDLTSRHNYLTSYGRNMPPYLLLKICAFFQM